jgi:hypothetical protein
VSTTVRIVLLLAEVVQILAGSRNIHIISRQYVRKLTGYLREYGLITTRDKTMYASSGLRWSNILHPVGVLLPCIDDLEYKLGG